MHLTFFFLLLKDLKMVSTLEFDLRNIVFLLIIEEFIEMFFINLFFKIARLISPSDIEPINLFFLSTTKTTPFALLLIFFKI
jgi:hypothetical protein